MISPKKFWSLENDSRLRKLWRIACEWETALRNTESSDTLAAEYFQFANQIPSHNDWKILISDISVRSAIEKSLNSINKRPEDFQEVLRNVNDFRHVLARLVGKEAAEWDLYPPNATIPVPAPDNQKFNDRLQDPSQPLRLVYCDNIRSPFNLGSIFRTAAAFGFDAIILSPHCPQPDHPRLLRSSMGTTEWVESFTMEFPEANTKFKVPVFGLELGGRILGNFDFPRRAMVVLGSEELGIHPQILEYCSQSAGIATIALPGQKASLNVGVSFGILAAAWSV